MRRAFVLAAALALLTGCGNPRQSAPDVFTPGPPLGANQAAYPQDGLAFKVPGGWSKVDGSPPSVATIATGTAVVAVWRYPRTEPLPANDAQLQAAIGTLAQAAKTRDASFTLIKSSHLTIGGKPAVQLRGLETIDGQQRMVRSTHIYAEGAEIVVDSFCALKDFKRVDAQVFRPLLQTMVITAPTAAAKGGT